MALTLALCLGLTAAAAAAPTGTRALKTAAAMKPHHRHHLHGVVVSVHHDKTKGHSEIKVKVAPHHHKKKAETAAAAASPSKKKAKKHHVVTVHVNAATKFEKVVHSQGKAHRHKAHFSEVHDGEHVAVTLSGEHHHARLVDIEVHQHNKKATPPTTTSPTRKPPVKKKPK